MAWTKWLNVLIICAAFVPVTAGAQPVSPQEIRKSSAPGQVESRAVAAKLQILLDRRGFSPGVIDGRMGENVENALRAFRKENGIDTQSKTVDDETWSKLNDNGVDKVIVEYEITEDDIKGPFTKNIPEGLENQKKLDRLGYTGPAEQLAEKFHMDEDFLKELNPGEDLGKAGGVIRAANVRQDGERHQSKVKRIEVDKSQKQVRAYGDDNELIAVYPATIGSEERPAPSGTLEVKGVAKDPKYTYNPKYKFEGVDSDQAFTIEPGPNNPVGRVWIELSEEGYGIHGTPEPAQIGKASSHGCVRLTNWDALDLAERVEPGVEVAFLGDAN